MKMNTKIATLNDLTTMLDSTTIESTLFKVFEKLFPGVEREKFLLFSIDDDIYHSKEDLHSGLYNIHYGQRSIKFCPVVDKKYWGIECEAFAEYNSTKIKTSYFRTGNYLYDMENDIFGCFKINKYNLEILNSKEFKIEKNGDSNYFDVERKIKEEKEKKIEEEILKAKKEEEERKKEYDRLAEERAKNEEIEAAKRKEILEKNTITEYVVIKSQVLVSDNTESRYKKYVKEKLKEFNIVSIEFSYRNTDEKTLSIIIKIDVENIYPWAKTEKYINKIIEKLYSIFGGEFDYKCKQYEYDSEDTCKKYAALRKEGKKGMDEIDSLLDTIEELDTDEEDDFDDFENESDKDDEMPILETSVLASDKYEYKSEAMKELAEKIKKVEKLFKENNIKLCDNSDITPHFFNNLEGRYTSLQFKSETDTKKILDVLITNNIVLKEVHNYSYSNPEYEIFLDSKFFNPKEVKEEADSEPSEIKSSSSDDSSDSSFLDFFREELENKEEESEKLSLAEMAVESPEFCEIAETPEVRKEFTENDLISEDSITDKYKTLEMFLTENNIETYGQIEIYYKEFKFYIFKTKELSSLIDLKKWFEEKGFTVACIEECPFTKRNNRYRTEIYKKIIEKKGKKYKKELNKINCYYYITINADSEIFNNHSELNNSPFNLEEYLDSYEPNDECYPDEFATNEYTASEYKEEEKEIDTDAPEEGIIITETESEKNNKNKYLSVKAYHILFYILILAATITAGCITGFAKAKKTDKYKTDPIKLHKYEEKYMPEELKLEIKEYMNEVAE